MSVTARWALSALAIVQLMALAEASSRKLEGMAAMESVTIAVERQAVSPAKSGDDERLTALAHELGEFAGRVAGGRPAALEDHVAAMRLSEALNPAREAGVGIKEGGVVDPAHERNGKAAGPGMIEGMARQCSPGAAGAPSSARARGGDDGFLLPRSSSTQGRHCAGIGVGAEIDDGHQAGTLFLEEGILRMGRVRGRLAAFSSTLGTCQRPSGADDQVGSMPRATASGWRSISSTIST